MDSLVDEHMDLDLTNSDVSPVVTRKKLVYSSDEETSGAPFVIRKRGALSPPCRGVRAMKLFDHITRETPQNPSLTVIPNPINTPGPLNRFRNRNLVKTGLNQFRQDSHKHSQAPVANVNPFTPKGLYMSHKRTRSKLSLDGSLNSTETDDSEDETLPPKRIALSEANISRYFKEFHEVSIIGKGEFGSVFKCIHRLDGCVYAIKRSLFPVAGTSKERIALNEVWANAVLGSHKNLVRYYSAWAEEGHIVIQNEFCNGGTLEEWMEENQHNKNAPCENQLKNILLQIAGGLDYIHGKQMAHLDIKPSNIFICREVSGESLMNNSDADDGFEEVEEDANAILTYKIGDMGHVASLIQKNVEEGDCRYLPNEILREDYSDLTKADIFSLGLTIYEIAGGGPLPKNGDLWHTIRQGKLRPLLHCSTRFHQLLESMIHPELSQRPTARELLESLHSLSLKAPDETKKQDDAPLPLISSTVVTDIPKDVNGKRNITPSARTRHSSKKMCRSLSNAMF